MQACSALIPCNNEFADEERTEKEETERGVIYRRDAVQHTQVGTSFFCFSWIQLKFFQSPTSTEIQTRKKYFLRVSIILNLYLSDKQKYIECSCRISTVHSEFVTSFSRIS